MTEGELTFKDGPLTSILCYGAHTQTQTETQRCTQTLLLFLSSSLSKKEVLKVCFIMLNWSQ